MGTTKEVTCQNTNVSTSKNGIIDSELEIILFYLSVHMSCGNNCPMVISKYGTKKNAHFC